MLFLFYSIQMEILLESGFINRNIFNLSELLQSVGKIKVRLK
jgi:hypothetical protein